MPLRKTHLAAALIIICILALVDALVGSGHRSRFEVEAATRSQRQTNSHLYGLYTSEVSYPSDLMAWVEQNRPSYSPRWELMHVKFYTFFRLGRGSGTGSGAPIDIMPPSAINHWMRFRTDEELSRFVDIQINGTPEEVEASVDAMVREVADDPAF